MFGSSISAWETYRLWINDELRGWRSFPARPRKRPDSKKRLDIIADANRRCDRHVRVCRLLRTQLLSKVVDGWLLKCVHDEVRLFPPTQTSLSAVGFPQRAPLYLVSPEPTGKKTTFTPRITLPQIRRPLPVVSGELERSKFLVQLMSHRAFF